MYEELITQLRADEIPLDELIRTMREAADAIEELLESNKAVIESAGYWMDFAEKHRWIPVAERLPFPGDKVIVTIKDESGDTRFDFTNTGWWSGYDYKFVVEDEFCSWVTHWMPLPTPPKEET